MREGLAADLARWEQGELRAETLRELHPDGEADELLQVHARLSLAMSAPDDLPDLDWEQIETRLDLDLDAEAERDEEADARRRRIPLVKLVIAFVAGALVNPFQPAERAVDGVRAVARSTADAVVGEVTDVFEPMIPSRTDGVVVLDPVNTQNLSAVSPEVPAGADAPDETVRTSPTPVASEPVSSTPTGSDPVEETISPVEETTGPDESSEPSTDEPASEPDGPPSTPPGHDRRAERSPSHGGGSDPSITPGHGKRPTTPPGHAQRPLHERVDGSSASVSNKPSKQGKPDAGPPSQAGGERPGKGNGRGNGPR